MDAIEKVVYINLAHRTDRKEQIEKELLKVFPHEKIVRFEAFKETFGYMGCTKSHIGSLELAEKSGWSNVLIVEDDMEWKDLDTSIPLIKRLISNPYDVIVFGGAYIIYDKNTHKLGSCSLAHCYLVSSHYYNTLIDNLNSGLKISTEFNHYNTANDQYWKILQRRDNWYIIQPPAAIQRVIYSDNQKRVVNLSTSVGKVLNDKLSFKSKKVGFKTIYY